MNSVVDLFCGAGGTALGFRRAGFDVIGAVDTNVHAAQTYQLNIGAEVTVGDVANLGPDEYRRSLGLDRGGLDVLLGCPPCQGFSKMRNGTGALDPRNDLLLTFACFVEEFMPKAVFVENVPGLFRTAHGRAVAAAFVETLRELGYGVTEHQIEMADYGVPQRRRRAVVLACSGGKVPSFPWQSHSDPASPEVVAGFRKPWRTVRDAISHLSTVELETERVPNHVTGSVGQRTLDFVRRVPKDGGSRTEVAREHWLDCHLTHDGHKDVLGRLAWDKPSVTITTGCGNPTKGRFSHPELDRPLTFREAAALQGFPDSFVFCGSRLPEQIGNAVPPPFAEAVAKELSIRLASTA